MIPKLKLLEKYLNYLLLFLLPSQLALHFWPGFAFVFGIRVDYLAPTIYFTDVLFVLLFIRWFIYNRENILQDLKKKIFFIFLFLVLIILNTAFSTFPIISLIKWVKIVEFIAFGYYIFKRTDIYKNKLVSRVLIYSIAFFSLIGILQFVRGITLGNIFYWIGERSFSIFTPGIALVNWFGQNHLRAYSTFPHPNSFAGYIGVSLIFLLGSLKKKGNWFFVFGLVFSVIALYLTFSASACLALALCLLLFLILKKKYPDNKTISVSLIALFLISFCLMFFSKSILDSSMNLSQSFKERLELAQATGKIFAGGWLTGSGLNTFVTQETFSGNSEGVWLLQPVHNVYLLILAEAGIVGVVALFIILLKLLLKLFKDKNKLGVLLFTFVLITSLFDHYWFTIEQNLFLLSFFTGYVLRENN